MLLGTPFKIWNSWQVFVSHHTREFSAKIFKFAIELLFGFSWQNGCGHFTSCLFSLQQVLKVSPLHFSLSHIYFIMHRFFLTIWSIVKSVKLHPVIWLLSEFSFSACFGRLPYFSFYRLFARGQYNVSAKFSTKQDKQKKRYLGDSYASHNLWSELYVNNFPIFLWFSPQIAW